MQNSIMLLGLAMLAHNRGSIHCRLARDYRWFLSFLQRWQTTHVRSWPRSRATAPSEKSCFCSRKAEPPIETRMCTWLLRHAKHCKTRCIQWNHLAWTWTAWICCPPNSHISCQQVVQLISPQHILFLQIWESWNGLPRCDPVPGCAKGRYGRN